MISQVMKIEISNLMLVTLLISLFFCFRSWWIIARDDIIIIYASLALPLISGSLSGWSLWKTQTIIAWASLTGFATRCAFAMELIFHSPAAMFDRDRISTMYFDNATLNALSVFLTTIYAAVFGGILGIVISQLRKSKLKKWKSAATPPPSPPPSKPVQDYPEIKGE